MEDNLRTCFVVSVENAEGSDIRHVCMSEETARKMFEEVKKDLIKRAKEMRAYRIKKGYAGARRDVETIRALQQFEYPGTNEVEGWVWDSPLVREHPLLD